MALGIRGRRCQLEDKAGRSKGRNKREAVALCGPIAYLVVLAGSCFAPTDGPSAASSDGPGGSPDAVSQWIRRSQTHVANMNEEAHRGKGESHDGSVRSDSSSACIALCEIYVYLDRVPEAMNLVRDIRDNEDRANCAIVLSGSLARRDRIETAIRCAESFETNRVPDLLTTGKTRASARDRSLFMVASVQSWRHDFSGAIETIHRIRDAETVFYAWRRLAETQAQAGQYDQALASLAKAAPLSKETEQSKKRHGS